jgi:hypothetical protein
MELIFKAWNKKKHVAGIFCDLTKAFDYVNHLLLFFKLQFYGIKAILLEWFRSYLIGRKQRANLKSSTSFKKFSNWRTIINGVPQGFSSC